MLKGIHYKNAHVYQWISKFLLGRDHLLRFEIAGRYLAGATSVLDVCAGTGQLRQYLPSGCSYMALEASPEFISSLVKKDIKCDLYSFEQIAGQGLGHGRFDTVVMVISFYQTRPYGVDRIIGQLKKSSRRCVIVEDVKERPATGLSQLMNYFCARDYYKPCAVFTRQEFETTMRAHGFLVEHHGDRYSSAVYESNG